jgi:DNA-binding NarL/FixJ family response regulator
MIQPHEPSGVYESEAARLARLSPRAREIGLAIAQGLTDQEIIRLPGRRCTKKTIDVHKAQLRIRLGLPRMNRVHICRIFIRHGLLQP